MDGGHLFALVIQINSVFKMSYMTNETERDHDLMLFEGSVLKVTRFILHQNSFDVCFCVYSIWSITSKTVHSSVCVCVCM